MKIFFKKKAILLFLAIGSCFIPAANCGVFTPRVAARSDEAEQRFCKKDLEMDQYDIRPFYYLSDVFLRCVHKKTKAVVWVIMNSKKEAKKTEDYFPDRSYIDFEFKMPEGFKNSDFGSLFSDILRFDLKRICKKESDPSESILQKPKWQRCMSVYGYNDVSFNYSNEIQSGRRSFVFDSDSDFKLPNENNKDFIRFINYLKNPDLLQDDEELKEIFEKSKSDAIKSVSKRRIYEKDEAEKLKLEKEKEENLKKLKAFSKEDFKKFYKDYVNPSYLDLSVYCDSDCNSIESVREFLDLMDKEYFSNFEYIERERVDSKKTEEKDLFGTYDITKKPVSYGEFSKYDEEAEKHIEGYYGSSYSIEVRDKNLSLHEVNALAFLSYAPEKLKKEVKKKFEEKWNVCEIYMCPEFWYRGAPSKNGLEFLTVGFKSRSKTAISKEKVIKIMNEFLKELLNEVKQLSPSKLGKMYDEFVRRNRRNYFMVEEAVVSLSEDGRLDSLKDYLKMDGDRILAVGDVYKNSEDCINGIEKILGVMDKFGDDNFKIYASVADDSLKAKEPSERKKKERDPSASVGRYLPVSFADSKNSIKRLFLSRVFCDCVNNEVSDHLEGLYKHYTESNDEVLYYLYSTKDVAEDFLKEINKLQGNFKISDKTFKMLKKESLKDCTKQVELVKEAIGFVSNFLEKLDKLKEGDKFGKLFQDYENEYYEKRFYCAFNSDINLEGDKSKNLKKRYDEASKKVYDLMKELRKKAKINDEDDEVEDRDENLKLTSELKEAIRETCQLVIEKCNDFVEQVTPMLDDFKKWTCEEMVDAINNCKVGTFEEKKEKQAT